MYSPLGLRKCWEVLEVLFITTVSTCGGRVAFRSEVIVCDVRCLGGIGRSGLGDRMFRRLGTVRWDIGISRRWLIVCSRLAILVISGFFVTGRVSIF